MTRALIVTPSYPVPDDPQAGIFLHRQAVRLAAEGVECRVLVFRPAPPPFPRWLVRRSWLGYRLRRLRGVPPSDGIPVTEVFYPRSWAPGEDVVPAAGEALRQHVATHPEVQEMDAVYAHWLWPAGAAALGLGQAFGWPVAAIARGSEMHDWHRSQPHCRPWVERVLREAPRPLANCQALRDQAEALVPGAAARMEVVYNGCDAEAFRPAADREAVRRGLGLSPQDRLLVFCGSLSDRKGLPELAAAWERFRAGRHNWRLVLIGAVSRHPLVARLRRDPRVTFTGALERARLLPWLQAADGYVQPSRLEGLANATMEAMAVGLPVVTTATCGQTELIQAGENGWLVPPRDVPGLVEALAELAADSERAGRFGREARRTIQERFDPREQARKLARVLGGQPA